MKFLKRLLQAYRSLAIQDEYNLVAETEFGWTEEDSQALLNFLESDTGQKFKVRCVNYVMRSAVTATNQADNSGYHRGTANGIRLGVQFLDENTILARRQRTPVLSGLPQPSFEDSLALS